MVQLSDVVNELLGYFHPPLHKGARASALIQKKKYHASRKSNAGRALWAQKEERGLF